VQEYIDDNFGLDHFESVIEIINSSDNHSESRTKIRLTKHGDSGVNVVMYIENVGEQNMNVNEELSSISKYGFLSNFWDLNIPNDNNKFDEPEVDGLNGENQF